MGETIAKALASAKEGKPSGKKSKEECNSSKRMLSSKVPLIISGLSLSPKVEFTGESKQEGVILSSVGLPNITSEGSNRASSIIKDSSSGFWSCCITGVVVKGPFNNHCNFCSVIPFVRARDDIISLS